MLMMRHEHMDAGLMSQATEIRFHWESVLVQVQYRTSVIISDDNSESKGKKIIMDLELTEGMGDILHFHREMRPICNTEPKIFNHTVDTMLLWRYQTAPKY